MINYQTTCNPQRIHLFLDHKLSDAELSQLESHLSDCNDCRRQLETAVASDDLWSEVRESLRGDCPDFCTSKNGTVPFDAADRLQAGESDSTGEDASSSQATVLKLLAPTDDDRMIGRWGTYEVLGVVGSGGMGVVLKAFDAALNRYVAIKILAPHLGSSGAAIRRFSREGKAAAAVVHDNVIEIYGVAEAAGLPYLVMPYVRGPSLQRRLDDQGPLAVVEILRVAMQAAAGLAAAHAQGLVHRDVKPANILLADGIERVKLTDFGLARAADDASLTRTGVIAGTPQYMSPEQARGEPVDPRSDLFSLGSVLYAMCTGRPPYRAETSYGVLRRITDEEPRPIREINPDIPEWLCGIVVKLMAKRSEDRFQSAGEVAALLEQCLAHVQQPTAVPLPTFSPLLPGEGQGVRAGWSGRKRVLATAIGLFLFGGLILAFGILIHLKKDNNTTTVEVPEGSTARVDDQGAVTVELPSSATKATNHAAESPAVMAKHFVELCSHGEFDKAAAYFDDALKEAVPPARLKEYWHRAGGSLQGEPEVTIENSYEYHVPLNWEHKKIDFKVLFNKHSRIAMLEPSPLPNTILPLDVLSISVTGTPEDQPIDGYYVVEPDGNVALGPIYGRVNLLGLRPEQAEAKTVKHLKTLLAAPAVQIAFSSRLAPWHAVAFPRSPYTIEPFDVLQVAVANAPSDKPIDNYFFVEDEGTIALGPGYGRVQVKGMTLEAAEKAVRKKLEGLIRKPEVQVSYPCRSLRETARPKAPYTLKPDDLLYIDVVGLPPDNPIQGIFSVEPGGTVSLGTAYGRAGVKGLSLGDAEKAIKKKLQAGGALEPAVSVTLAGWINNLSSGVSPGPLQQDVPDRPVAYGKMPRARSGDPIRKKGESGWIEPTDLSHPHAVVFDGSHFAKVEPPPKFTSGDFTISLWFYPVRNSTGFLLMRGFSYRDQRGDIGLSLYRQEGSLDFKAATGSNQWIFGWHPQSRLHGDVRYDRWNHAAVTRRGDTYTMWMNGAPVASEKSPGDISDADNTNPFIVGGMMDAGGVTATFLGALDDLRIFRRCLSEKEIAYLFKINGDEGFLQGEGRLKLGPLVAVEATQRVGTNVENRADPLSSVPDISGNWQGQDWGRITLKETASGQYTGASEENFELPKVDARSEKAILEKVTGSDAKAPRTVSTTGKANVTEAPWGQWNDDWAMRLRPDKATLTSGQSPEFTLDLRRREAEQGKTQEKSMMLNLGIMLGNGGATIPTAVHLVVVDSKGTSRDLSFMEPRIAGRVDDWLVPLSAGSTYSLRLRLADFWCPATKEFRIALAPGEYRLHAVLESEPPAHVNSDMPGIRTLSIWKGALDSAPITIRIVPDNDRNNASGAAPPSGGKEKAR